MGSVRCRGAPAGIALPLLEQNGCRRCSQAKTVRANLAPGSRASVGMRALSRSMATPDSDLTVTPSLIDRLIDRDPRADADPHITRAQSVRQLKASLRRDLE